MEEYIKNEITNNMKDHEYTLIAVDGDSEIWRCCRPKSSVYGFDICISRFGISVHGDINNLSFRVGSDYGMSFLAGDDVDYYIHSKLESIYYYKKQVSPEKIKEMLAMELHHVLEEIVCEDGEEGFNIKISEGTEHLESMLVFAGNSESSDQDGISEISNRQLRNLYSAYSEFDDSEFDVSEESAYQIMIENTDVDMSEALSITIADESTMRSVYFVNHAAKEIMKLDKLMAKDEKGADET